MSTQTYDVSFAAVNAANRIAMRELVVTVDGDEVSRSILGPTVNAVAALTFTTDVTVKLTLTDYVRSPRLYNAAGGVAYVPFGVGDVYTFPALDDGGTALPAATAAGLSAAWVSTA